MIGTRATWALAGIAWAVSGLLFFSDADIWDPTRLVDFAAIWAYSVAWVLLAPAVILLARIGTSRARAVAAVCATGCLATGIANGVEDGLGVAWAGTIYVVGFFVGMLALLRLATTLWQTGFRRLAAIVVALFLGIFSLKFGGGFLLFGAMAALAAVPGKFTVREPDPSP
ncbi:MAG: hypothetical protein ABI555_01050 [Chloroflexota bacterium]